MPTLRVGCVHCGSYACRMDLARPGLCRHSGLARDPVPFDSQPLPELELAPVPPDPPPASRKPGRQKAKASA